MRVQFTCNYNVIRQFAAMPIVRGAAGMLAGLFIAAHGR